MSDENLFSAQTGAGRDDDAPALAAYAQQAYLEYALSVVKGRALPDVCDGQKPVQRRILYAMGRMGLGFAGANAASGAKPVKSARVVGDVLGKFHPHGVSPGQRYAAVPLALSFTMIVSAPGHFARREAGTTSFA